MCEDKQENSWRKEGQTNVWELGNAVTRVTGVDHEKTTSCKNLCLSALTQAMGTSSIPIVASKNKIPLRGHVYTLL